MSAVVEEADGFEVIGEAPSGEQCLVAAGQLLPDLVLIDIDLPGMDRVEATSRLRARPSPPVVLLVSTRQEDAGAHFVPWCGVRRQGGVRTGPAPCRVGNGVGEDRRPRVTPLTRWG